MVWWKRGLRVVLVFWLVWEVFGGYSRFACGTKHFDTIESEESAVRGDVMGLA